MDASSEIFRSLHQHRFIFIGGLHKSGTSLLSKLLAEHPHISGFQKTGAQEDEGQHLQNVYLPGQAYGGAGKFGFVPEAHLTEHSALVTDRNRIELFSQWQNWWDTSRPLLMEKSPPNLLRARFLQAFFPNSHFIMVLRHPIAVSLATQKWSRTSLQSLLSHWLICHRIFADDAAHLKHLITVRYESLVAEPQTTIDRLCLFLKIPSFVIGTPVMDHNLAYFEKWNDLRRRWRSKPYASYLTLRFDRSVRAFGYRLNDYGSLTVNSHLIQRSPVTESTRFE